MSGIKKWISTTIEYIEQFPLRITFIVLSISIAVLHFLCVKKLEDYPSGIITEFIGIIVTIFVVDLLFKKKSEKDKKDRELDEILRMAKLLDLYFERYKNCFVRLISFFGSGDFDKKFEIKDLENIYNSTTSAKEGLVRPAHESFYEIEKQIVSFMEQVLAGKPFQYYPKIQEILEQFVGTHLKHDSSMTIFDTYKAFLDTDKTCRYCDEKMLSESTMETYEEGKAIMEEQIPMSPGDRYTALAPYIHLYDLLIEERDIFYNYKQELSRIKKEVS